jgi:pentapeptide MXKDX repeat protein
MLNVSQRTNRIVRSCSKSISTKTVGVALLASLAITGCAFDEVDDEIGSDQSEIIAGNGMSLNGMSLNGMSINGMSLNGMSINGMSINGMSLNGMSLNGMSINGSQLAGTTSGGQPVSGSGLVGATLAGLLSDGGSLTLRITSAQTLAAPNKQVWAYGLEAQTDTGWQPLCGTQEGVPVLAIPLTGLWNYASGVAGGGSWSASGNAFTFGCRGTALAKCVELGYKPTSSVGGTSLRHHHQACTRMLRADYCGDGTSWTTDGTPVNLYDALGIQSDAAAWLVDAEWTPNGAVCTNNIRDFQPGSPSCVTTLHDPDCGSFAGGALIIDEYGT